MEHNDAGKSRLTVIRGVIVGCFGGRNIYLTQGMVDISWSFPTVLNSYLLGDGLRDALDPRPKNI